MPGINRSFALGLFAITVINYGWHQLFSHDFPPGMPWDACIACAFVAACWPNMPLRVQRWLYAVALVCGAGWILKMCGPSRPHL